MTINHANPIVAALLLVPALVILTGLAGAREDSDRVRWEEKVEVASGPASIGPWRMNDSEFHYVDDATVAINDQGYIAVAFADNQRQDIYFRLFNPDGEANGLPGEDQPVNVSQSEGIFSWLPRMIITSADDPENIEVFVLWQDIVFSGGSHGGEIFFARSSDGGRSFSEPINLSNTTAGAGKGRINPRLWHNGSLDIARDEDGTIYAAWTEYEGNLWLARSTDNGESFSDPLHISGGENGQNGKPARAPSLALADNGTVHIAWAVGDEDAADIHFATSSDGGESFSEPRAILESGGHSDAPRIAVDSEGTIHLVYGESPRGPLQRYHLRYARSTDGGESFDDPRPIAREHADRYPNIHFPMLRLDGSDNLYLLWEIFPERQGPRPVGLGFTISTDGGETFAPERVVPDSEGPGLSGSMQGLLSSKLAVNRDGRIAVVNSTIQRNESSHIWLTRGQAELEEEE